MATVVRGTKFNIEGALWEVVDILNSTVQIRFADRRAYLTHAEIEGLVDFGNVINE